MNKFKALLHPFETIATIANSQLSDKSFLSHQVLFEYRASRLTELALHSAETGISSERICNENVIISLTSYGQRIYDVYLAIESIMQGSVKPNQIILWLSKDEFYNKPLPITLQNQIKRGLEVCFYKDIRSYKKLIPSLQNYPQACIITIDDDAIYDFDFTENMIESYKTDSSCIWANRIHEMTYTKKGILKSYLQWNWAIDRESPVNVNNFFSGVGGVLYPPQSLHKETYNEDVFTTICPTADDVWFNAMARLNKTKIRKTFSRSLNKANFILNESVQVGTLSQINNDPKICRNDIQIHDVFKKYGILPQKV